MKYAWAVPGAKVVCINGNGWYGTVSQKAGTGPVKGDVCTIKSATAGHGYVWLALKEWPYGGYAIEGFRPLVSQDDDIAMFQRIADRALAQNGIHVSKPHKEHA